MPDIKFNPLEETKEQFQSRYIAAGNFHVVWGETHVALPCTCEDGGGPTHWACVNDTPEAVQSHLDHEQCLADLREMGAE